MTAEGCIAGKTKLGELKSQTPDQLVYCKGKCPVGGCNLEGLRLTSGSPESPSQWQDRIDCRAPEFVANYLSEQ